MEAEVSQKELMKKLMNSNSASAYVNPWLNELIGPAIIPVIMLLNPTSCVSSYLLDQSPFNKNPRIYKVCRSLLMVMYGLP